MERTALLLPLEKLMIETDEVLLQEQAHLKMHRVSEVNGKTKVYFCGWQGMSDNIRPALYQAAYA